MNTEFWRLFPLYILDYIYFIFISNLIDIICSHLAISRMKLLYPVLFIWNIQPSFCGCGYPDETNLRIQFAFSNSALPVEHKQIKGSLDTQYCFNTSKRVTSSEVCEKFSIYNQDTGTFNHKFYLTKIICCNLCLY